MAEDFPKEKKTRVRSKALRGRLEELEETLNAVLRQTGEAVVVCDPEGRIIRASSWVHELCGCNPVGSRFDDLFALRRADGQPFHATGALRGESHREVAATGKTREGQSLDLLVSTIPLGHDHDHRGCIITLARKAPQREHILGEVQGLLQAHAEAMQTQAEELQSANEELAMQAEELQAQNEELANQREELLRFSHDLAVEQARLEAVLEHMPAGVIIAEAPTGKMLLVNRRMEEILRHPQTLTEGVENNPLYRAFLAETALEYPRECPLGQSLREGVAVLDREIEILRGDGAQRVLRVSATPVRDQKGRVVAGVGIFADITERRRAEKEIARLASFPRINPNPVLEMDLSGEVTYHNAATLSALERSGAQGDAASFFPRDMAAIRKEAEQTGKDHFRCEVEVGDSVFAASIFLPKGLKVARLYAMDITERKQAERALQKAHAELEHRVAQRTADLKNTVEQLQEEVMERQRAEEAIKTSHHFLQMMNKHTELPAMLREFVAEIKKLSRCEAVGIRLLNEEGLIPYRGYEGFPQEFYDLESPLSIHSDRCMCINVIKGTTDPTQPFYSPGGSFHINSTTRFLATVSPEDKGEMRNTCNAFGYESLALVPIRLGERILGLIHLADPGEDMVSREKVELLEWVALQLGPALQRVRYQEALDAERHRFYEVLEMLPAYLVLLTPDYHVPYANRYFVERFGESGGKRCFEYLFGRTEPCEICETYTVLKTHAPHHWEWTGPDGRNYDINDFPFTDSDGSPLIMEMGIDITERKQAEGKLLRFNEELEQMVRERTAQLEVANTEMESFCYSVSHDLKTPLRAIHGFSRMLADEHAGQLNAEALRLLRVVQDNSRLMAQLIDDLLTLSRLGRQEMRRQSFDLSSLAKTVFQELTAHNPDRTLHLTIQGLPRAYGDRRLLKQVLVNLLQNAVTFTRPRESAQIEVGGWTEGKEAVYFVKDNGVGFDMKYADKLFGVFQTVHRRTEYKGTGVGLAIVQRIIQRHGGRVWAESKVNEGAAFYFSLPPGDAEVS